VDFQPGVGMLSSRKSQLERPVGGAPSRSGFLATPIDASPRHTLSEMLSIPGEEMPCTRPNRSF